MSLTDPSPAGQPGGPAPSPHALGIAAMQTLDDAIAFRRSRLAAPCGDCGPGRPCPDHVSDARQITSYQQRHHAENLRVCAALDLDPAGAAAADGDTEARTDHAFAAVMLARMREWAAAGPVLADLGEGPHLWYLDGDRLAAYPVDLPGGPAAAPSN
jgi:hypothetical protein